MQLNTKKQLKEKSRSNIIPCMTKSAWISTGILARSDRRQSMKPHDLVQLWKPFWCFLAYPSMARAILPYFSDFTRCPQRSTRFVICWLFLPSFLPSRLDMLGTCNSSLNFEQVLLPSQKMGDMNWLAESRDMCVCVCVSMHLAHGLPLIFTSMASMFCDWFSRRTLGSMGLPRWEHWEVVSREGSMELHVATCHQTMLREPVHLTWTILEKLKCPWNLLSSRLTTRKRLLRH